MDSETVRLFEEDGYLTALPIHGPEAVRGIRDQFNALENAEGKENCSIRLINRHMDIPFIWQLATDPKILDYMELLMGPDIMVLATHIFCKYEKTEKFVAWHQDVTYWGLEPPYALTAWYAIDDSVVENGCMRVIPGSHQHSIVDHGTSNNPNNLLSIGQEIKSPFEERKAVDLPIDVAVFTSDTHALLSGQLMTIQSSNLGPQYWCVVRTVRTILENGIWSSCPEFYKKTLLLAGCYLIFKHFERLST